VKVEGPHSPDYVRFLPPMAGSNGALFEALNSGKRALGLDLKHSDGPGVLKRLVRSHDVLVESFRPGVMERLGVGYQALRTENPALVYCAISGYGQDGPLAQRAGHDLNYMALSGALGLHGDAGGPVRTPGVQVADIAGGALNGALGVVAALLDVGRGGPGRLVDISMTEGALQFALPALSAAFAGDPPRRGEQTLDGGLACYRTYETADGEHLAVGALEPQFWQAACRAAGRPDLAMRQYEDAGPDGALQAEMEALIASKSRADWEALLAEVDACIEPVLGLEEVAAHPQHRARSAFVGEGLRRQAVVGPRFLGQPPEELPPAATTGEHSREILAQAGIAEAEIEALIASGAVQARSM